jgi:putative membrane protein
MLMAIKPHDRWDWVLENTIPVAGVILLLVTYTRFKFTRLAYYLMFFYVFVLSYGGHYTYALAPPFNWLRDEFGLARNHYDRVAHFMLGFLMAIPIREILAHFIITSRRWLAFIVAALVLAIGAFYEFIEWWTAIVVSPELGAAFLGTQGDVWDTQWDMFLALVGAICALALFTKTHDRQLGIFFLRSNKTPQ